MDAILKLDGVEKVYHPGTSLECRALQPANLEFTKGRFYAIVGKSGSGKSTMLHILGGLDRPTGGKVYLEGKSVFDLKDRQLAILRRRRIGFVFQSFNLLSRLTAVENVALPLIYAGVKLAERTERAEKALEAVGLGKRLYHKPNEMSGGQRQRVAIARALINNPAIIMADEPTGNLDTKSTLEIIDIFEQLNHDGKTVIMVTHEPELAAMTQRILTMRDGCLIQDERKG